MPNMTAGDDELYIEIPGREPLTIPVTINAGSAKVVYANTKINEMQVNGTSEIDVTVTDIWNNTIPGTTQLDVRVLGSIAYDGPLTINAPQGETTLNVRGIEPGGRGYVSILVNGINFGEQLPGVVSYTVQNSFVPKEDLNVMYMNIFGGDWANQWGYFSTNDDVTADMINDSPKLLAVTTQLTNPEKLYQFVATLDPSAKLTPEQAENHAITFRNTGLYLQSTTQ